MFEDPTTVLISLAQSSSPSDQRAYSFQAQGVYKFGGVRLDKCLIGAVNYANALMRITTAHKLEDWIFCAEENLLTKGGIYVGAFYKDTHYTFERLCDSGTEQKEVAQKFQAWILDHVLGLFYQEGIPLSQPTSPVAIQPTLLKAYRIVPNTQTASDFARQNADIMP